MVLLSEELPTSGECPHPGGSHFLANLPRVARSIWELIPSVLLPQGPAVAYLNAHTFMEEVVMKAPEQQV